MSSLAYNVSEQEYDRRVPIDRNLVERVCLIVIRIAESRSRTCKNRRSIRIFEILVRTACDHAGNNFTCCLGRSVVR